MCTITLFNKKFPSLQTKQKFRGTRINEKVLTKMLPICIFNDTKNYKMQGSKCNPVLIFNPVWMKISSECKGKNPQYALFVEALNNQQVLLHTLFCLPAFETGIIFKDSCDDVIMFVYSTKVQSVSVQCKCYMRHLYVLQIAFRIKRSSVRR